MTLREAQALLRDLGITLKREDDEYVVNFHRGREENAYYTTDLEDAVNTGIHMAHHGHLYRNPKKWDVGERVQFRRDGTMVLPAHRHLNPKRLTRAKARLILHHGEVRGYPLTEPQRRFFGARASGYPRRNAMARGYGASSLPAHYRRRTSRRRHLPPMAGHKIVRGHYRHNPAGGTNWMPIVLIGAAAFFLLPRLTGAGGLGTMFGTSVLPPGYTYMGSGYYRGPDGQTYYRSPTTGQLSVASPGAATTAIAQNAGYGLINTTIGAVAGGLTSLIKGIFTPSSGAPMTSQPSVSDSTVTPGAMSFDPNQYQEIPLDQPGGASVGLTPEPLPDFQPA